MTAPVAPFALLDDATGAGVSGPASRYYTGWLRAHISTSAADLEACCARVQSDLQTGCHAVLLADFEWGMALQGVPVASDILARSPRTPALVVHVFERLERLAPQQVDHLVQQLATGCGATEGVSTDHPADVVGWSSDQSQADHAQAIRAIHEAIRAGETYQVNHTRQLSGRLAGDPVALFARLRRSQPVPYGALLALPDVTATPGSAAPPLRWVLSHSPELMVSHHAGRLRAQPMKGTAPADSAPEDLAQDPKNRAENLMIVDLLRNDLGRVAQTGSVRVRELFAVQRHPTLLQMTSTIEADLRPEATLADVLRAAFPCGSITGAPRRQTLRWIAQLERSPRGLYTGAIGWLDAGPAACPNAVLSVAIRTLALTPGSAHTPARPDVRVTLGVGGGIVLDSQAEDEWAESALKARFAQSTDPGYTLFETLLAERQGAWCLPHLAQHLARLRASARALGFKDQILDYAAALEALWRAAIPADLGDEHSLRLRLDLSRDGRLVAAAQALVPLPSNDAGSWTAPLVWASGPLFSPENPLLHAALTPHKTSWRQLWDAELRQAMACGGFDAVLWGVDHWDDAPFVVDGARSTLYARVDGVWCTPPVADGALPGTVRARVLAGQDATAQLLGMVAVQEQRLTLAAARRADAWAVSNALRGVISAHLSEQGPGLA